MFIEITRKKFQAPLGAKCYMEETESPFVAMFINALNDYQNSDVSLLPEFASSVRPASINILLLTEHRT